MKLAIFDLDNTLIAADSDYLWGEFLCENGYVNQQSYRQQHEVFYQQYVAGQLDIQVFLEFQLAVLAEHDYSVLTAWRAAYLETKIKPVMLPKALALIALHREQGHTLLIITATNRFITAPIATAFGIPALIACEPEMVKGQYTGRVVGTPAFREGKVVCLKNWLAQHNACLKESWFYSDSHNDLPLLQEVDHAIAVDPDPTLRQQALERGWQIISLRG